MHTLPSHRTGYDLHRTRAVVAPGSHGDLREAALAGHKKSVMPREQTSDRERLCILSRCVEHHLDHAVDVAVRRSQPRDVQPHASSDGRADLVRIELLALDLAALDDVRRQGLEDRLLPKLEPQSLHVTQEMALPMANRGEEHGESFAIPVEARPLLALVDIHSPHLCGDYSAQYRVKQLSTHAMRRIALNLRIKVDANKPVPSPRRGGCLRRAEDMEVVAEVGEERALLRVTRLRGVRAQDVDPCVVRDDVDRDRRERLAS